jgi:hypothetical protein
VKKILRGFPLIGGRKSHGNNPCGFIPENNPARKINWDLS